MRPNAQILPRCPLELPRRRIFCVIYAIVKIQYRVLPSDNHHVAAPLSPSLLDHVTPWPWPQQLP